MKPVTKAEMVECRPVTRDEISSVDVYEVEDGIGMDCGAWDMVDHAELIAVCYNVVRKRLTREAAEETEKGQDDE